MTSRSSFSKAGFIREILRRNIWAFALAVLGFFFSLTLPVAMMVQNVNGRQFNTPIQKQEELIYAVRYGMGLSNPFIKVVMLVLAVVCAVSIFSYLHSRQRTDFYHSLPVSRGTVFTCNYLAGVIIVLPAYFIMLVIAGVIALASGGVTVFAEIHLLATIITHFIFFFVIYALATACTILCGNTIVSLLLLGWSAFSLSIATLLWDGLKSIFYSTYTGTSEASQRLIGQLSPVLQYLMIEPEKYEDKIYWITSWRAGHGNLAAVLVQYIVVAVILTALAYFLFRYRKSETAGTAIAFAGLKPPLKFWCCTVMALGGGMMLYSIGDCEQKWLYFGFILGGVLTHFLMEIIYGFDFRAIFTHWKSLLIYTGVFAIILTGIHMDITGYDRYLPDAGSISAVDIQYRGYQGSGNQGAWRPDNDTFADLSDPETIDVALQLAGKGVDALGTEDMDQNNHIIVCYLTKSGKQISRQYTIPYSEENDRLFDKVRFSKEYIEKRSPAFVFSLTGNDRLHIATSVDVDQGTAMTQNEEAIAAILEALREDILQFGEKAASSEAPVLRLTFSNLLSNEYMYLNNNYMYEYDSYANMTVRSSPSVSVYPSFTKTLAAIEKYTGTKPQKITPNDVSSIELHLYNHDDDSNYSKQMAAADKIVGEETAIVIDPLDIAILLEHAITAPESEAADLNLKLEPYVLQEKGFEVIARLENGLTIPLYYPAGQAPNQLFVKYFPQ